MNHSDLNFCPTFFCLLFTCFSLHPKDTEWSRVQPITFDHTSSNHLLSTERRKRHENNPVWLLKRFEFWRSCFLSFVTCDFETWNDWYGWYWCIDAMCRPSRLRSPERECWASEDGQHVPPRSGFFDVFLRKKHRKVHKRKKTEKHVSTNGKFLVWSTNRKTLRKLHLRYQLHVLMLYNGRDTDPSIGQWWWPAVFFSKRHRPVALHSCFLSRIRWVRHDTGRLQREWLGSYFLELLEALKLCVFCVCEFQGQMSNIPWPRAPRGLRAPDKRGLGSAEISMCALARY